MVDGRGSSLGQQTTGKGTASGTDGNDTLGVDKHRPNVYAMTLMPSMAPFIDSDHDFFTLHYIQH